MNEFKSFQQETNYTCGPAVIRSILYYYNKPDVPEKTLTKMMKTTAHKGTFPCRMVECLKHYGFKVKEGQNGNIKKLLRYVEKGIPVIVEWIDWGGHWVTIIKSEGNLLALADPAAQWREYEESGVTFVEIDRFKSMWFDANYFPSKGIYIIPSIC